MTIKILAVASECAPVVKTGGLADVVGALARVLGDLDVECRVLMPLYRSIADLSEGAEPICDAETKFGGPVQVLARREAGIDRAIPLSGKGVTGACSAAHFGEHFPSECQAGPRGAAVDPAAGKPAPVAGTRSRQKNGPAGIDFLLVDAPHLYDRPGQIYLNERGTDWPDNHLRFGLLCWLGAKIGREGAAGWRPHLIHAHDWQAGLAPVYSRQSGDLSTPSVITIHNISFQGNFPAAAIGSLGLDPAGFTQEGFEFFDQVSFLKGGLMYADRITTVSPTYARELLTEEFGMGLDGVLNSRKEYLTGILNGIDTKVWNPADDPALAQTYSSRTIAKKSINRQAVLDHFSLQDHAASPLLAVVSRLSEQKGLDIALQALPGILDKGARFVLLGTGSPALESGFAELSVRYPDRVGVDFRFNEDLAHLIQAGADALLVPSRYEPCGLTQLCAMRYGTMPIVARTGGLADTVIDANEAALAAGCATGIQFAPINVEGLRGALDRALELYADRKAWQKVLRNAMRNPVGWDTSATRLAELYREMVER